MYRPSSSSLMLSDDYDELEAKEMFPRSLKGFISEKKKIFLPVHQVDLICQKRKWNEMKEKIL